MIARDTYDGVLDQAKREGWEAQPTLCPHCANGAVIFGNEDEAGNHYDNFWICSCSWCDTVWMQDFVGNEEG